MMNPKKIIVWGHKLDTGHTNAYVQLGFFRAAQYMGYETYWLDNRDNLDESFFDDSLIISEQWAVFSNPISNKLPMRKTSYYFINYVGNRGNVEGNPRETIYIDRVKRLYDMRFACDWPNDKNWDYTFQPEKYIELQKKTSFFEKGDLYDIIYSFWASDLLPNEFDESYCDRERKKYAFFGGTIRPDNEYLFHPFIKACNERQIPFYHSNPWQKPISIHEMRELTSNALLSPDFRPRDTAAGGYVSCRTFKNLSYGNYPSTNSKRVSDFYEGQIPFSENTYELFDKIMEKVDDRKTLKQLMNYVKENHTFVNRINVVLKCLKEEM